MFTGGLLDRLIARRERGTVGSPAAARASRGPPVEASAATLPGGRPCCPSWPAAGPRRTRAPCSAAGGPSARGP
eukprot:scaffold427094_cov34-Prasinocladus_malaysianus.AAC.1